MLRNNHVKIILPLVISLYTSAANAAEYTLAVHPVLPTNETRKVYQPLANYLGQKTGHNFTIVTNTNFLTHWQTTKAGKYDLILDGPQFTGYRLVKRNYTVLAKFPDVVSYTLVAGENEMILEPKELIGKKVATTPSPALGALRLHRLFPNPLRQPAIVETDDSETAAEYVANGKAHAAIIPAAMVGNYPQLITVVNTEQLPAPALSASPEVEDIVKDAIRKALLDAENNDEGRKVLESLQIERFTTSDGSEYRPHAKLLEEMWEY